MAEDEDRHVLGDPLTRLDENMGELIDDHPAGELSEAELRRQLTNTELNLREASRRGTPEPLVRQLEGRLAELATEYQRRGLS